MFLNRSKSSPAKQQSSDQAAKSYNVGVCTGYIAKFKKCIKKAAENKEEDFIKASVSNFLEEEIGNTKHMNNADEVKQNTANRVISAFEDHLELITGGPSFKLFVELCKETGRLEEKIKREAETSEESDYEHDTESEEEKKNGEEHNTKKPIPTPRTRVTEDSVDRKKISDKNL